MKYCHSYRHLDQQFVIVHVLHYMNGFLEQIAREVKASMGQLCRDHQARDELVSFSRQWQSNQSTSKHQPCGWSWLGSHRVPLHVDHIWFASVSCPNPVCMIGILTCLGINHPWCYMHVRSFLGVNHDVINTTICCDLSCHKMWFIRWLILTEATRCGLNHIPPVVYSDISGMWVKPHSLKNLMAYVRINHVLGEKVFL